MAQKKQKKPKRKPGPAARYGYRPTLTIRLQEHVYERIKAAAYKHGKSLSEEIEDQLGLIDDLGTAQDQLETLKLRVERMHDTEDKMHRMAASVLRDAGVARTAAYVQAIRDAGFQILREVEGKPDQVIISRDVLQAEAKLLLDKPDDDAAAL